ncbi:sulfurtransferase TusA family protein [Pseudahrensia aquimaris]|uniref:sulfurtransferase TusA family protein n=1 Tax=Pseudahrensia aquimaris TaxID=744461 RepID=UPI00366E880B
MSEGQTKADFYMAMEDDFVLDLRGLQCPLPVLKTRNAMRKLGDGERLWVRTDDPLAVLDVPNFCNEYGQGLLEQKAGEEGSHWFHVERRGELR